VSLSKTRAGRHGADGSDVLTRNSTGDGTILSKTSKGRLSSRIARIVHDWLDA